MTIFKENYLALMLALIVGLIYIGPQLLFIYSLGEDYRGIPMMKTPNEDFYLARIQEIIDGHPLVGSSAFYEYKGEWPMQPPTVEMIYALPSLVFGFAPASVLVASKFVLPFILFLAVYFLIRGLTGNIKLFSNKANAVAGALLVTLGHDLIDYRSLWRLFGGAEPGGFLIWARPVNPIMGAVFLMLFLVCVWRLIRKTDRIKTYVISAAIFLALMMASYFFSWGMAFSVLGVLCLIYLIKRDYGIIKKFALIILLAVILASPYWYGVLRASQSELYADSVLRNGLFYTHYPLVNKLMLATLAIFIIVVFLPLLKRSADSGFREKLSALEDWHWMSLAFIFGSLWVYSQQVITGMTVWPYHFVQYSIPLAMVVAMALLYNVLREKSKLLWATAVLVAAFSSVFYGVYVQASVYNRFYSEYESRQSFAPVFEWLNQREKDCVVLVSIGKNERDFALLSGLIPAFTHCNVYLSTWVFSLMPEDRRLHNYMVLLRLKGVEPDAIEEYLQKNKSEARVHLFSNWKGLYGLPDFPDFADELMEKRLKEFPEQYRLFLERDFKTELKKYRIDYILSDDNLFLYSF